MEDQSSSSSVVTVSFLQRIFERLSSTKCLKLEGEEAAPVAVVSLQRYLSDQSEDQPPDTYSYDVTVTDGVWRAKCLLHHSLNHLVQTNTLKTGTDISLRQCSFVYNERRLGHGYICIEELECGAERSVVLSGVKDVGSIPILVKHGMERSVELQSDVPLKVSRKHYLSLWNNDDPEGDIWTPDSPPSDSVLDGETPVIIPLLLTLIYLQDLIELPLFPQYQRLLSSVILNHHFETTGNLSLFL